MKLNFNSVDTNFKMNTVVENQSKSAREEGLTMNQRTNQDMGRRNGKIFMKNKNIFLLL
jgi:hypothetical protein